MNQRKMHENMDERESWLWWQNHMNSLNGHVPDAELQKLAWLVGELKSFGFEQGSTRPGSLGQWDVYYTLRYDFACHHALLMSGLSANEIAKAERNLELEHAGVNPDDPQDVADYEAIQAMSPEERDKWIAHLEAMLHEPT